ncbi:MAG: DUF6340 family protein [Dysgonomonas sp.]
MKRFLFCSLLAVLFCSCGVKKYLDIDVQKPAQVTFPADIVNVAIMDNSLTEYSDSSSYILVEALTQFIGENNYFDHVAAYSKDNQDALNSKKLKEIMDSTTADALILLNYYNLTSDQKTARQQIDGMTLVLDTLNVGISASISIFDRNGKTIAEPINIVDTLSWEQVKTDQGVIISYPMPSTEDILKNTAVYVASEFEKKLVPHWETQTRWFYSDGTTKMKEAAVAVGNNRWESALSIWKNLYNAKVKNTNNGKLASNIALAYEMLDNMDEALVWITIAEQNFSDNNSSQDPDSDKEMTKGYKQILEQRVQEMKILDLQQ